MRNQIGFGNADFVKQVQVCKAACSGCRVRSMEQLKLMRGSCFAGSYMRKSPCFRVKRFGKL